MMYYKESGVDRLLPFMCNEWWIVILVTNELRMGGVWIAYRKIRREEGA